MKKQSSYGGKVKLLVSVLMVVTLLVTSAIGFFTSYRLIRQDMENQIASDISTYTSLMENWLNEQRTNINFLVDNIEQNKLFDKDDIHAYIKAMKNASLSENISSLYIVFPNRDMVEFTGWEAPEGFDATQRPWYISAASSNGAVFTDPYLDEISGKLVVTVSRSIMRGDKLLGVIGCDIFMDSLVEILQQSQSADGAYVFLTTPDMNIIRHPETSYSLGLNGATALSQGAGGAYANIEKLIRSGSSDTIKINDYDGKVKYISTAALAFSNWQAIGVYPASRIVSQLLNITALYGLSFLVLLAIALFISTRMSKTLFNPLVSISNKVSKMAEGDLSLEFDEKLVSSEMEILVGSLDKTVKSVRMYINDIKQVLHNIEDGNLTAKPTANYLGDYIEIKESLENILRSLNEVFGSLNLAATQVSEGAGSMAASAQNLAQTTTEQSESLDHITGSVSEISDQTQTSAKGASQINEIAQVSKLKTLEINNQMQSMLDSMDEIERSSNEISKIIKTINDIAFQTNILALNAAVEAARAGSAGKGFAVVADEVRSLANHSAEAANQTTAYIESSVLSIASGHKIAQGTAEALSMVTKNVEEMAELVGKIAESSNVQAQSVSEVTHAIDQVTQAVHHNSATSEETAAASEQLSSQALMMRSQLDRFRLAE